MKPVFLQLFVPAFNKSFDIKVSNNLKLFELQKMVYVIIGNEVDVDLLKKSKPLLCDRQTGVIFNINLSIAELNLRNGSELMLI